LGEQRDRYLIIVLCQGKEGNLVPLRERTCSKTPFSRRIREKRVSERLHNPAAKSTSDNREPGAGKEDEGSTTLSICKKSKSTGSSTKKKTYARVRKRRKSTILSSSRGPLFLAEKSLKKERIAGGQNPPPLLKTTKAKGDLNASQKKTLERRRRRLSSVLTRRKKGTNRVPLRKKRRSLLVGVTAEGLSSLKRVPLMSCREKVNAVVDEKGKCSAVQDRHAKR